MATSTSQAEESDPLAHLYKMSRTAGLGSGDYVAINPVAVTSLVFGLAGALVVVDSLFLLLPVVGLILGIIAFRQVRSSSGTQTGTWMAVLAILLSLGFLGGVAGTQGVQSLRLSADKVEVNRLTDQLGHQLSMIDPAKPADTQRLLADAYSSFDEAFKSRVPLPLFAARWLELRSSPYIGPFRSLHLNGLTKFEVDTRSGDLTCVSIVIAEFQKGDPVRWTMTFRQLSGSWYVEDIPDVFPPPTAAGQQPRR